MPEMTPIQAAESMKTLESYIPENSEPWAQETLKTAASYLRKIAAGEYKPVVHGNWKRQYKSGVIVSSGFVCSACDCFGSERETDFCPRCGALMGKDDSHE